MNKATQPPDIFTPNGKRSLTCDVAGIKYARLPVRTRRIKEEDNLLELLKEYVVPHLKTADILFISEKIVALTQGGRIIRIDEVKTSALARFLAAHVRNHVGTEKFRGFGHGTAPAMQLLIEEAGIPRTLVAAALAAVTRPLGVKGVFYFLVGKLAKSVDCPMSFDVEPYMHYAKRPPHNPSAVAKNIYKELGVETVIVDANYLGALSLGKSSRHIKESFVRALLKDNPAGQADEMTPFFLIRKM